MKKLFLRLEKFNEAVRTRGPDYAAALAPAIVERTSTHVVFDARHPAYAAGERFRSSTPAHWGTALWNWFHEWAGTTTDLSPAAVSADLKRFAYRIECGDCQNHWLRLIATNPPPFNDRPALQRWTYDRHAEVSKSISKPSPTYAQASRQWWTPRDKIVVPDRVVVISLDSRPDRWEAFIESRKKSKLLSSWDVERFRARLPAEMIVPDYWTLPHSTWASDRDHRAIVESSYVAGHEWTLVFEDDALVMDCFDEAYTAACQALPLDAYFLNLTTDGHVEPPAAVSPGLVRSNMQYFLHAYLVGRRGMHRLYSEWTRKPDKVSDGTVSNMMRPEPHFYAVTQNAVLQTGDRSKGDRVDFYRLCMPSQ